jgi:dTMP kinase
MLSYYGAGLPYRRAEACTGRLVVIEGMDGSGRSTQAGLLKTWLEARGHAVADTGLRRSALMGRTIERAKEGNILGKTTLSLLYATDLADGIEHIILPALEAGFVVLADRYVFTLMVRDLVRGADPGWLRSLFGFAPVPDLVFYLQVPPEVLLHRHFKKRGYLDYWESGMDLSLSTDVFESFHRYQRALKGAFDALAAEYDFVTLDGTQDVGTIQAALRERVSALLAEA